ncbi:MAG: cupin domain-containing protein [Woeseiaceae bacterium]|nr:cupin domain-containing protein [Woeseiaceae bacterium]
MVRVIRADEAIDLQLPGRKSLELVSAVVGSAAITLRLVEIPVAKPGEKLRAMHRHSGFEECMYVLAGQGSSQTEQGATPVTAGDAILVPPGELHVTRNTGTTPLRMLCFFPTADCSEQK